MKAYTEAYIKAFNPVAIDYIWVLPMSATDLSNRNFTSAEIDKRLIHLSQITPSITWQDIILVGNDPHGTSAEVIAAIEILYSNYNKIYE